MVKPITLPPSSSNASVGQATNWFKPSRVAWGICKLDRVTPLILIKILQWLTIAPEMQSKPLSMTNMAPTPNPTTHTLLTCLLGLISASFSSSKTESPENAELSSSCPGKHTLANST